MFFIGIFCCGFNNDDALFRDFSGLILVSKIY